MMQESKLLKTKEAATYLKISYWLLLNLVREKKIPHIRVSNIILFRIESLDTWVIEREKVNVIK